ncbi:MAG: DUF167 domain-containing protein [Vicinamibacterales bacterium]
MISDSPAGAILDVRVIPRAGRTGLAGTRDGALLVRLAAAPVDGAANAALIELLASTFSRPRRAVTILSGETSRHKRVRIEGLTADAARAVVGQ